MAHTAGEWKAGKMGGSVIAESPVGGINGNDDVKYYGGHLIAESIAPHNQPIIVAAPDLLLKLKRLYRAYCISRPMAFQDGVAVDALEAIIKAESW